MTTTTIRLPDNMAHAIKASASNKGKTMNELLRYLIDSYLREEDDRALYDSFTILGLDKAESDVEFAIHAASEVVLKDE